MKLSLRVSWFLVAFGVWSWVIWITFVKNLWQDGSGLAFDDAGHPTAYFWVHLTLAVVSFVLGTVIGGIGLRGVRAHRAAGGTEAAPGGTEAAPGGTEAAPGGAEAAPGGQPSEPTASAAPDRTR